MWQRDSHKSLYFCLFIFFLLSMNLWIGWDDRQYYLCAVISVVSICLVSIENIRFKYSVQNVISLACIIIAYSYIYINQLRFLMALYVFIPYAIIILLNDKDKQLCLKFIYKWFAYLMILSIIVYILVQTVGLPSLGKIWMNHAQYFDREYILRDNYLFYVYSDFYGVILE